MAAYRHRKQRIKNANKLTLVLGLSDEKDVIVSREHFCSFCNVRRTAVTSSYRLDDIGGRLHSTVCMGLRGLPTAFVGLSKPETIENHVL